MQSRCRRHSADRIDQPLRQVRNLTRFATSVYLLLASVLTNSGTKQFRPSGIDTLRRNACHMPLRYDLAGLHRTMRTRQGQQNIASVTVQIDQVRSTSVESRLKLPPFRSWVHLDLAAVHEQLAAGDEAGLIRCQEEHGVGDLGRISSASQGCAARQLVEERARLP